MATEKGKFVVLVGADGVGKTSVAQELLSLVPGRYFHFRPPLGGIWDDPTLGKVLLVEPRSSNLIGSIARMVRNLLRFWLGYLSSIRPALRSGLLVVGDRWAYGYLAKPQMVNYSGPRWLARGIVRAMPQPDLVVALTAPAEVIVRRKDELTLEMAKNDDQAWCWIPVRQLVVLNAQAAPREVALRIIDFLRGRLEGATSKQASTTPR